MLAQRQTIRLQTHLLESTIPNQILVMFLKICNKIIYVLALLLANNALAAKDEMPKWFTSPKQNNSQHLYGIGSANTLEEATKYALVDLASRLIVSISAESQLIREENQQSFNEEMRQKVQQSIEKISFSNYETSNSTEQNGKFFVEIKVEKQPFVNQQQEQISFLQQKITDLDKLLAGANFLQKQLTLNKILILAKELELKSRIIAGTGEKLDLSATLSMIAKYQDQLNKATINAEFYFSKDSKSKLTNILKKYLNKQGFIVANQEKPNSKQQVLVKANYISTASFLYSAYMVKLKITFENIVQGNTIASNSIEITGNSTINEDEAINSALTELGNRLDKDGILSILGISN